MKNKKITKNTQLSEVLQINPDASEVLFEIGLTCIGCPMATAETLEQGCKAHGMKDKQIEMLIKKLNK
ncbi:MAG: DUF1858 domain-containing protein [Nanoarchaeota archaeon]|nr:DUF1858 domain-containing protein [Nanoarchaeota archaeon]